MWMLWQLVPGNYNNIAWSFFSTFCLSSTWDAFAQKPSAARWIILCRQRREEFSHLMILSILYDGHCLWLHFQSHWSYSRMDDHNKHWASTTEREVKWSSCIKQSVLSLLREVYNTSPPVPVGQKHKYKSSPAGTAGTGAGLLISLTEPAVHSTGIWGYLPLIVLIYFKNKKTFLKNNEAWPWSTGFPLSVEEGNSMCPHSCESLFSLNVKDSTIMDWS